MSHSIGSVRLCVAVADAAVWFVTAASVISQVALVLLPLHFAISCMCLCGRSFRPNPNATASLSAQAYDNIVGLQTGMLQAHNANTSCCGLQHTHLLFGYVVLCFYMLLASEPSVAQEILSYTVLVPQLA